MNSLLFFFFSFFFLYFFGVKNSKLRMIVGTPDADRSASVLRMRGRSNAPAVGRSVSSSAFASERDALVREVAAVFADEWPRVDVALSAAIGRAAALLAPSAAAEREAAQSSARATAAPVIAMPTPLAASEPASSASLDDIMSGVIRGVGNRRNAPSVTFASQSQLTQTLPQAPVQNSSSQLNLVQQPQPQNQQLQPQQQSSPSISPSPSVSPSPRAVELHDAEARPTGLVSFKTTQGDLVSSGFLLVNGMALTQGDLLVIQNPPAGSKGGRPTQRVASVLAAKAPLRLPQLQTVHNLVRRVLAAPPALAACAAAESGAPLRIPRLLEQLALMGHRLDLVGEHLRLCLDSLVHRESLSFPVVDTSAHFDPVLPQDVAVKYFIFNRQLIFELYVVRRASYAPRAAADGPPGTAAAAPPARKERPRRESRVVGSSFEFLDGSVEVLHHLRVSVPVPLLSAVVELLERAAAIVADAQAKVECLRGALADFAGDV
jgi:hypothetical protein